MRTYDSQSMIDLPTLDGLSGSTLAKQLLTTAAAEKKLAAKLTKRVEKLKEAEAELSAALGEQLSPAASAERADLAAKSVWSALDEWLSGWSKLPDSVPQAKQAAELKGMVLPDGLVWLRQKAKDMWAESNRRLVHIEHGHLAPRFEALGGTPFLTALKQASATLGFALGITGTPPAPPESPAVGKKLDQVKKCLREYVVQVVAQIEEDEPSTQELHDRLLQPLLAWESKPAARRTDPQDKNAGDGKGDGKAAGKDKGAPSKDAGSTPADKPTGGTAGPDPSKPPQG